jgi:predicted nucleotidyltransferase
MNHPPIPEHPAGSAASATESSTAATTPTAWKESPLLSLEWRLDRVRKYLNRLPLPRARGIVYGSVGRRAFGMGSDTDLLVLSEDLPPTVRERIDILGDHRDGLGEIDAIGWTESEWTHRLADNDPFATLIQREGIALGR